MGGQGRLDMVVSFVVLFVIFLPTVNFNNERIDRISLRIVMTQTTATFKKESGRDGKGGGQALLKRRNDVPNGDIPINQGPLFHRWRQRWHLYHNVFWEVCRQRRVKGLSAGWDVVI